MKRRRMSDSASSVDWPDRVWELVMSRDDLYVFSAKALEVLCFVGTAAIDMAHCLKRHV